MTLLETSFCIFLALLLLTSNLVRSTDLPVATWPSDQALAYDYSTKIRLSDRLSAVKAIDDVSVEFAARLSFSSVARLPDEGFLVELKLAEPRLGTSPLTGPPPKHAALLVIRRGAVDVLYVHAKESTFWTNHYKGIASLITSQASSGEHREVDGSGECLATYSLAEDKAAVRRSKKRCSLTDFSGEVSSRDAVRQVRRARVSRTTLVIPKGRLESARSSETVRITVSATAQEVTVESEQQLQFTGASPKSAGETKEEEEAAEQAVARCAPGQMMHAVGLASGEDGAGPASEKELRTAIEAHREALRHDQAASVPAVVGFGALLQVTRRVRDARVLSAVIGDDQLDDVTPVLGDALVACGSGPCLKAALDWVSLRNADRAEESERLLLGLSLLSDPDEATLKRLLDAAKAMLTPNEGQEGVRAQLWATLGALTGRFGLSAAGRYAEVTGAAAAFLVDRLQSARNEDDALAALNALANLRSGEPVPVCLELLTRPNITGRLHCAAVRAIEALEVAPELRGLARGRALRAFNAHQKDVTARLCSLDLLLHLHPTLSQLVSAGRAAQRDDHLRFAFLLNVRRWAEREERLDAWRNLHRLLPGLWRYPGPRAMPPVLEEAGFGRDMHFRMALMTGPDGTVRRSDTAAHLQLPSGLRFPLYQLAIFTDGLGAVASGASGEGSETEVTAGLSMRLLGASLRPVRFFSGYSGLMTAVWNAPSSLTPFLQTNMAFLEASHLILLQNGLSVRFTASGLASIDLSGLVSISMWSQRADTQLKTQAAVELTTGARLATGRFSMQVTGRAVAVAATDFNTHVAFSSTPPELCLVATRPDTIVELTRERRAQVGATKPEVKAKHDVHVLPAATLSLGRANERACASLVPNE